MSTGCGQRFEGKSSESSESLKENQQRAPANLTPAQTLEAHEAFELRGSKARK